MWHCKRISDADIGSWVEHPCFYWLKRCCRCGRRKFRLWDVWPAKQFRRSGFHLICAQCLISILSEKFG